MLDQAQGFDPTYDSNQFQWYAFPTQETTGSVAAVIENGAVTAVGMPEGDFTAQTIQCSFLRGHTYAYRLGTPLLVKAPEALRDATPCSDRFYDIIGEATN